MSPERTRAWAALDSKGIAWHRPSTAVTACVDALEEVEHLRPIVDLAKALVHAKSGQARADAIVAVFGAVGRLERSGR